MRLFKKGNKMVRTWLFKTNELNKIEIQFYDKAGFFHLNKGIAFVWKKMDDIELSAEDFYLSRIASQGIQ